MNYKYYSFVAILCTFFLVGCSKKTAQQDTETTENQPTIISGTGIITINMIGALASEIQVTQLDNIISQCPNAEVTPNGSPSNFTFNSVNNTVTTSQFGFLVNSFNIYSEGYCNLTVHLNFFVDLNGDGVVNESDYATFRSYFGSVDIDGSPADLDRDRDVDATDFQLFKNSYLRFLSF